MPRIIKRDRSIIPACDVTIEKFEEIVKTTADIEKVGAYKIGIVLGLNYGLPKIVEVARRHTNKPLIYDHQKAGTDIPEMGDKFAEVLLNAGFNAAILFPQAGPITQEAWTKALQERNLGVLVGGLMTHKGFNRSDGGYLADESVMEVYKNAVNLGVTNFVVPGNKVDAISKIKYYLESMRIEPIFYAPGFIAQGGIISEGGKAAGERFHAIVGNAIYKALDIRTAALELTSQI